MVVCVQLPSPLTKNRRRERAAVHRLYIRKYLIRSVVVVVVILVLAESCEALRDVRDALISCLKKKREKTKKREEKKRERLLITCLDKKARNFRVVSQCFLA